MGLIKLIILYSFSFLYFDLSFFRNKEFGKRDGPSSRMELIHEKRKEKRKLKRYKNKKYIKPKKFKEKNFKYQGTGSKDKRFSNQKMIRRMFRNS